MMKLYTKQVTGLLFVLNPSLFIYCLFSVNITKTLCCTGIVFLPHDALYCKVRSCDRMSSVRLSVCDVGGSGLHRLEILETNCMDN